MLEINDVIRKLNSIKMEVKSLVKETDYYDGEGFSELKIDSKIVSSNLELEKTHHQ